MALEGRVDNVSGGPFLSPARPLIPPTLCQSVCDACLPGRALNLVGASEAQRLAPASMIGIEQGRKY